MKQKAATRKRGGFFYEIVDLGPQSTPKAFGASAKISYLLAIIRRAALFSSISALTFCRPTVSALICFPNCTSNLHLLYVREECAARCKTGYVWNTYLVLT
jgi:hypothetical protein